MSVYRIALSATRRRAWVERGEPSRPEPRQGGSFIDMFEKLTKWIPAETLAVYAPGITIIGQPSFLFLVAMIAATPLFVLGVAFATGSKLTRKVWVSAGLATGAFAIWSLSVPMNGWQIFDAIGANQGAVAAGGAVAGILFGYLAEGLTARLSG